MSVTKYPELFLFFQGFKHYKEMHHEFYLEDAMCLSRQEPCPAWIKAAMPHSINKNTAENWMVWIDKEIQSKGLNTDVLRGWTTQGPERKKMPRELSTALWLLKYGIQGSETFSTLYGLFSSDSYPKKMGQRYWDPDYLTVDWVTDHVIYPVTQIVAVFTSTDEDTVNILTDRYLDLKRWESLITCFKEVVRINLVWDILEVIRFYGPDPQPDQDRVRAKLYAYAKNVAIYTKGIKETDEDTIGVMEAMLQSLPMYIKNNFSQNHGFMMLDFPCSMSERWPDDTELRKFRIQVPMVDLATNTTTFGYLQDYFKAVMLGNIDPPPFETFRLEKNKRPKKSKVKSENSNQKGRAIAQQTEQSPSTTSVRRTVTVQPPPIIVDQPSVNTTIIHEMPPLPILIGQSSVKPMPPPPLVIEQPSVSPLPIVVAPPLTASESVQMQGATEGDESNRTREARLNKKIILNINRQHARLLQLIKDKPLPNDVVEEIQAIGRTLSLKK